MPSSRQRTSTWRSRASRRGAIGAVGGAAIALTLAGQPDAHPATLETLRAAGAAASLGDSRGGAAIVRASDMRAGQSVSGDVTIGWSGDTPAAVTLAPRERIGRLADVLAIAVDDRTSGRRVYEGPLTLMGDIALDQFAPGSSHDFRFTVTLDRDAGDAYQGAPASLRFDWTATADDASTPADPPTPAPPAPSTPTPTPTTPTPPADTRPPLVALSGRKLAVVAACDEPCTFRASVKLSHADGVKKPKVKVKAGATRATITLTFDRRSLAKLKRAGAAKAVVTIVAADAAGNRAAAKRIALRP